MNISLIRGRHCSCNTRNASFGRGHVRYPLCTSVTNWELHSTELVYLQAQPWQVYLSGLKIGLKNEVVRCLLAKTRLLNVNRNTPTPSNSACSQACVLREPRLNFSCRLLFMLTPSCSPVTKVRTHRISKFTLYCLIYRKYSSKL